MGLDLGVNGAGLNSRSKTMGQTAESGKLGNEEGYLWADEIAALLGATRLSPNSNEFQWAERRIEIKTGSSVAITEATLSRVDAVVYGEQHDGEWSLYEIDPQIYRNLSEPSRGRGHKSDYRQVKKSQIRQHGVKIRESPPSLYLSDETAWLDLTAELVRAGRFDQVDAANLAEFLTDMARRDRKEVTNRLIVLLCHLLKWDYQPDHRSKFWMSTILEQQRELLLDLEGGSLRTHAISVFAQAYERARKEAMAETSLDRSAFPESCPWDLDAALADRFEKNGANVAAEN